MATNLKNLSVFDSSTPSAENMKFGIVVAEWNSAITGELLSGAIRTLKDAGCEDENILVRNVPGTFELSLGAQFFAQYTDVDAIIVLGCVIQGETRHFDFVCQGVTEGVNHVSLTWNIPVAFGVLTTENQQQALDRAGGKHGNKGDEAAYTAIKMVQMQVEMCIENVEEDFEEEPDDININ
ncbi:MAG: 6,7-dimethyl-8-ribityllumazine synthase [Rikenellaceae bacterium]